MFNTPPRAATSTRSLKHPQFPKPSAYRALIITDGTTTVDATVARSIRGFLPFESSIPAVRVRSDFFGRQTKDRHYE